jgi:hypothetical protein
MSIPARAARNTKSPKERSVTGKPARPLKNSVKPAAASPKRRLKTPATPAGTGRAVTDNTIFLQQMNGTARVMNGSLLISDLLERYMQERGYTEHWITVQEFRTRMSLDKSSAHAIAGFLQRLHNNPSTSCRYTVARIENVKVDRPYHRIIRRYLIRERPIQRRGGAGKMTELRNVSGTTVKSRQGRIIK